MPGLVTGEWRALVRQQYSRFDCITFCHCSIGLFRDAGRSGRGNSCRGGGLVQLVQRAGERHFSRHGARFELRPAGGGEAVAGDMLAASPHIDLADLRLPSGTTPAEPRAAPERGAAVWAVGPEGLGRALAQGPVLRPALRMRNFGPGFLVRLGALMGFSGGPAVGRGGRLLGLTTALTQPGHAPVLAALTGMDLDGLLHDDQREVFVLSIQAIEAELARLAPQP